MGRHVPFVGALLNFDNALRISPLLDRLFDYVDSLCSATCVMIHKLDAVPLLGRRLSPAVSIGRCNALHKSLCRRVVVQCFAGPLIEQLCDLVQLARDFRSHRQGIVLAT